MRCWIRGQKYSYAVLDACVGNALDAWAMCVMPSGQDYPVILVHSPTLMKTTPPTCSYVVELGGEGWSFASFM
jgi:hypothetical protein